jgi:hypothetical protein
MAVPGAPSCPDVAACAWEVWVLGRVRPGVVVPSRSAAPPAPAASASDPAALQSKIKKKNKIINLQTKWALLSGLAKNV